ncbi:hypothetical protein TGAM01_v206050 [Trichoderma gamsii]|uniref:Isochorismatase-like domain-containing protein n=1 Tax=Trichoderma gamsii TaxID=398673 RepID=A0A2P4ZL08_9HYPO|nr:hypothetical protein TGAM01_v206050 [Trichoderma gamsii]PON24969.1 hypothetical protein TGAM01_v206050 [Trichoderma gamsii]
MYKAMSASLEATNTVKHIFDLLTAARSHKIPVFYGLHQQYNAEAFYGWTQMKALHESQKAGKVFEEGSWGAKIYEGMEPNTENGDLIFSKHWSSSSFQNTDLDFLLRQRTITNVVIAGLTANACVESTARYAYDLGYHVTLLSDATASFTHEQKHAATEVAWPLFASKVVTVEEYVASL